MGWVQTANEAWGRTRVDAQMSQHFHEILPKQVKFREFLSTEYGEAQLDFLLEAMKLETLDADEQDQAATKVCLCWSDSLP